MNQDKKALELVNNAVELKSNYAEVVNLQKQIQGAVNSRINAK